MNNTKQYIKFYLTALNFTLFIIGFIIVGASTDWNGWALFGTFVASIHLSK